MTAILTHCGAAAIALLLLLAAGQPLFSESGWWHLAMGAAYAASGPPLHADPLLHTAAGAPATAAWLTDLTFHGVERAFGFNGLRTFHASCVAGILALAWSSLRRASGSAVVASLGTSAFGALAAYRLFQLRPELFTIFATLLLIRLLVVSDDRPGWGRVAGATVLMALWANLHASFVLGPILLSAATAGAAFAAWWAPARRAHERARAARLASALVLGLLATLANPAGSEPHRLYFTAGEATPDLAVVADEWTPVDLFALPVPNFPPSLLSWMLVWAIVTGTAVAAAFVVRRWATRTSEAEPPAVDFALAAVGLASVVGMLFAVRFLWLAIFPLCTLAQILRVSGAARAQTTTKRATAWATALAAMLLVPAFVAYGDWPMISNGVRYATYGRPYPASKYYAYAVWFLRDAELEGNLWNDYATGNFLGYWLAPRLRSFVNSSLNVPKEVMEARHAIVMRGWESDVAFTEILDRYHVDIFFGTGEPVVSESNRGTIYTTTHLENTPGWTLIFRNLRSAVYLRANDRNAENLDRVAAYYAEAGVPFDPERGLDVEFVLRDAPDWAIAHGMVPVNFADVQWTARSLDPLRRPAAQMQLASTYAALGAYRTAEALGLRILRTDDDSLGAARLRLWCLLHLDRSDEALDAAEALAAVAPAGDALSLALIDAARDRETLSPDDRAARVAMLPVFTLSEGRRLFMGVLPPKARLSREE